MNCNPVEPCPCDPPVKTVTITIGDESWTAPLEEFQSSFDNVPKGLEKLVSGLVLQSVKLFPPDEQHRGQSKGKGERPPCSPP